MLILSHKRVLGPGFTRWLQIDRKDRDVESLVSFPSRNRVVHQLEFVAIRPRAFTEASPQAVLAS